MFADLASIRPRICPKTPGRHGPGVGSKSATTLSKINLILQYKAKTDLVSKSDQKIGSTLSLEEHQPCIRLVRLSQDEQDKSL